jgi:hypothetical protein
MYLASGALFSTIDTVAEEKPLAVATSRMVTVGGLLVWRFKGGSPVAIIILPAQP